MYIYTNGNKYQCISQQIGLCFSTPFIAAEVHLTIISQYTHMCVPIYNISLYECFIGCLIFIP